MQLQSQQYLARIFRRFLFSRRILFFLHYNAQIKVQN